MSPPTSRVRFVSRPAAEVVRQTFEVGHVADGQRVGQTTPDGGAAHGVRETEGIDRVVARAGHEPHAEVGPQDGEQ